MNAVLRPRLLLCIAIALAVTGCGLSSPYIKLPSEAERNKLCSEDACSIDNALSYSRQVRANYRAVLDRYARLRTGTGAALLGIGAAALGFSAVKAHRDVFTTLGFAGAATYSFEKFYENPDREEVFQQAIDALYCAEAAVGNLHLPTTTRDEIKSLAARIQSLPAEIDALRPLLAEMDIEHAKATQRNIDAKTRKDNDAEQISAADQDVIDARVRAINTQLERSVAAQDDATTARVAATRRLVQANEAGHRLMQAVDAIVIATEKAAAQTIPDPSSVFAMIGDLTGLAERFLPSAGAVDAWLVKNAAAGEAQAEGVSHPSGLIASKVQAWDNKIDSARSKLDTFIADTKLLLELAGQAPGDAFAPLQECTVAGLSNIALVPASLTIPEKKAMTFSIDVDGGKPPYASTLTGVQTSAITFTPPRFNESRFVVTVTDALAAGKYEIAITDATRRKATFTLTASSGSGGTSPPNNAAAAAAPDTTPASLKAFQSLKATVAGRQYSITGLATNANDVVVTVDPPPAADQRTALRLAIEQVQANGETLQNAAAKLGKNTVRLRN